MKEPLFSDTVVYESPLVRIGAFRCHGAYPGFRDTGPAQNDCFVFPRTAVQIEHEDAPPFVANPNTVTFYNRSQCYQRQGISEHGDRCDWFGVRRDLAREAVRTVDPKVEDTPFRWHRGPSDPRTYLLQRRLFDAVANDEAPNPVVVEETVLLLLDRVIGGAIHAPPDVKKRALVHEVECLLATRFNEHLGLIQIAAHAGVSPYHLCRTFREVTGFAIHAYLRQLRIRHGLERVCETSNPLDRIAVDLGFTHHSHFTHAFRRDFEITPSALRSSRFRC
ncbi:MAG TPA: AraC family transcriptional regulator [Bryobacteraceae bacterium]|nr:AraC family transcriptional regulator [Bryobacteraceae bacterium]